MKAGSIDCEDRGVEPIHQWVGSKIDIVVRCRWSMDDERAKQTITILHRVVGVIPLRTVSKTACCEFKPLKRTEVPYCVALKR